MAEIQLLASSGTVEGIQQLINQFFYSDSWRVDPETLEARNETQGKKLPDGLRVIKKRGRYRFEMIFS